MIVRFCVFCCLASLPAACLEPLPLVELPGGQGTTTTTTNSSNNDQVCRTAMRSGSNEYNFGFDQTRTTNFISGEWDDDRNRIVRTMTNSDGEILEAETFFPTKEAYVGQGISIVPRTMSERYNEFNISLNRVVETSSTTFNEQGQPITYELVIAQGFGADITYSHSFTAWDFLNRPTEGTVDIDFLDDCTGATWSAEYDDLNGQYGWTHEGGTHQVSIAACAPRHFAYDYDDDLVEIAFTRYGGTDRGGARQDHGTTNVTSTFDVCVAVE